MNTKQTPPSQEAQFEDQLRKRVEHRGALSPDTIHVADTSTGEQVELDPVRKMSAFEIYKKIKKQVDAKSAAEMGETLGVDITTEEVPAKDELDQLMRDLAEDIYDALEKCHKSIAVIKPESIGSKTIARLDEKGDANFLVSPGEGERLYESLQNQAADFRTVEKNSYGFVLENKTVGFKVMFIYQERLQADGSPRTLEDIKTADMPDQELKTDDVATARGQQGANQSNMGQGWSLAA